MLKCKTKLSNVSKLEIDKWDHLTKQNLEYSNPFIKLIPNCALHEHLQKKELSTINHLVVPAVKRNDICKT